METLTAKGQWEVGTQYVWKNDASQIGMSSNGKTNTASEDKSEIF